MTIKISVYIATSLDGFIARPNGDIDWLPAPDNSGEDYGYAEFISSVDHLVMGRNTFEKALTFGQWPYSGIKVIVLTSKALNISPELADKVEALHLSPRELVHEMEIRGAKHIYLDGGVTIQGFLRNNLVDEITITTVPTLIGAGLPLFSSLDKDIKLKLISSQYYKNGLVQSKYKFTKE